MNDIQQINLYIGTMGFSYKDWNDVFYPKGIKSRDYLNYYSRIFNSVEIDSTFYGTPKDTTIQHWIEATPERFKFSLKVPRVITHDEALVNVWGFMAEFLEAVRRLEGRLGIILFQFPPSFTISYIDRLTDFFAKLPGDIRFALEVRHKSWYVDESKLSNLLADYQIGWAATQYPHLPVKIHPSADFIYIRWIGQHGSFHHHSEERIDRMDDLKQWWQYIQTFTGVKSELFGYFNNDYAGFGAGTALKFKALVGETGEISPKPKQDKLF